MVALELLAPARTADIGIAAIRCGADAVYVGGPSFGARSAACNSIEDIVRLCGYASRYGVKIYVTVNTLAGNESERLRIVEMMKEMRGKGISAFILQDTSLLPLLQSAGEWEEEFHASTQCSIRTPERALQLAEMGFSRLILERQLSLEQIRAIRRAVPQEVQLEAFVHGAVCVCYSGDCYLSEFLTSRSANRGECAQPCRNLYDLVDSENRILAKDKPLLSLKDLSLATRVDELVEAGVSSFKIEGRLKGESYVKNVVKAYSEILDGIVAGRTDKGFARSSWGRVQGGFTPDLNKTFNRGYTGLFIDAARGEWNSQDAAGGLGERIGSVTGTGKGELTLTLQDKLQIHNGDGLCFIGGKGEIVGFRVEKALPEKSAGKCGKVRILVKDSVALPRPGSAIWRNYDIEFERALEKNMPLRFIDVSLSLKFKEGLKISALREDGKILERTYSLDGFPPADNQERMREMAVTQLSKKSDNLNFSVGEILCEGPLPLMSASFLNSVRREIAENFSTLPVAANNPAFKSESRPTRISPPSDPAALKHPRREGELMRSKYCIRAELGICLKKQPANTCRLFLKNNGKLFPLTFDCQNCEMTLNMPTCR